jgi:thiol-disulfide isomerase/thioredoxin
MRARFLGLALLVGACSAPADRGADAAPPEQTPAAGPASAWTTLAGLDGAEYDLGRSFAAERAVALVFWQTWCSACLREGPQLAAADGRLAGSIDFYGVVTGPDDVVDEAAVASTARQLGLPYPQVRDRSAALARRFGVRGTPTIVVIEPSGEVSYNGHELPAAWGSE